MPDSTNSTKKHVVLTKFYVLLSFYFHRRFT
nr:MAG TPA: hypothetical protein [Caudoviricetes sp.]